MFLLVLALPTIGMASEGPEINQPGLKVGALFSPSGKSLLFARDTQGPDAGEFFVWNEGADETWPPECSIRK